MFIGMNSKYHFVVVVSLLIPKGVLNYTIEYVYKAVTNFTWYCIYLKIWENHDLLILSHKLIVTVSKISLIILCYGHIDLFL